MARPSKKSQILQAAAELFGTKGFKATTVRDIAERAGVLSGSLYAHIDTKEDLLVEVVRQAAQAFTEVLAPIVASSRDPREKLRLAVHAHIGVIAASRAWSAVYLDEETAFSDSGRQEVRRLRRAYEEYWTAILEEGVRQGIFVIDDLPLARLFTLSALNGIHRWYNPQGRLSAGAIADRYTDMLLKVLAPFSPRFIPEAEDRRS